MRNVEKSQAVSTKIDALRPKNVST